MNDLEKQIEQMSRASADADVWQPEVLDAAADETWAVIERLLDAGLIHTVHDTLDHQLRDLMEIRNPKEEDPEDAWLDARALEFLPLEARRRYGTWVYYPWTQKLVHLLPEDAFLEVRLVRNRNKITPEEQARLGRLTIGVAGLSVGQTSAHALATEGIGRVFRLADFNRLALSNLNRLRGGVHDLAVNKSVLAARSLYEIDPYLDVAILPEGVTPENVERFVDGLDVLVEECDDLYMKIRMREVARDRRIPVLMDTSDRGLLDVERFDREPDRPVLHGLVRDLVAADLAGLTTKQKVPYVLDILGGADQVSSRLAASMVEIRDTLTSWPQLASDVLLGGALCADAVRRIALDDFSESGRYYVELDKLVADGQGIELDLPPPEDELITEVPKLPSLAPVRGTVGREDIRTLVHYGVLAPSGGNAQPWLFEAHGDRIRCIHDVPRSESFLDFQHRASYLAFGAVVENITIAASRMGLGVEVTPFPSDSDATLVCELAVTRKDEVVPDPLFGVLAERSTNRRLGDRVPLEVEARSALLEAAVTRGGRLQLLEDAAQMKELGELLAEGDRIRFLSPIMHREMMNEVRWTTEEALRTRDGLDIGTLELTPTDRAGMQISRAWRVMDLVGRFGGGRALGKPTRKAVAAASAIGLVTSPGRSPRDAFAGGRALQRVWLTATAQGLVFQPLTAIVYLFARLEEGGTGLSPSELAELPRLRETWNRLLHAPEDHAEMMLFRVAKAGPPTVRALRRPVEDVLRFA